MFKISEVAAKLNVETYVIFEKLLTHADVLKPYTKKIHSINYVDEDGVGVIKALIEGKSVETVLKDQNETSVNDDTEIVVKASEKEIISEESTRYNNPEPDDVDWLTDEDLQAIDEEKIRLRKEVSHLRHQLIQYDSELKRQDDALLNYQILMKEDVDRLITLEERLEAKLFRKAIQDDEKESSGGVFGFRKR